MKKILLGLIGLLFAIPVFASNNLPSEYTELQYIESTGTQWIDTGISVGDTICFNYKASPQERNQLSISSYVNKGVTGLVVWQSGGYINFRYKSNNIVETYTAGIPYDLDKIYNILFNENNKFYIDGVLAYTKTNTIDTSGVLVTGHYDKVYNLWVKSNTDGSLIFNGIPCRRNSDNVLGMYDTVSGTFFTNAGTGEFIAGPVVPEQQIRIATTAYNSARFSPVVTELNTTIATIRSVVTNTINQTKAIADLQATKQTRPNEQCPAGKKCLLVEDNDGTPHWYEIIENAD